MLLRHGANMGVKNWDERPPVNRILPATLQEPVFTQRRRKIMRAVRISSTFPCLGEALIGRMSPPVKVSGMFWLYFSLLGRHLIVSLSGNAATVPASQGGKGEISVCTFVCNLT